MCEIRPGLLQYFYVAFLAYSCKFDLLLSFVFACSSSGSLAPVHEGKHLPSGRGGSGGESASDGRKVSLSLPPPEVVHHGELDEGREDEGRAGAHPDVYGLRGRSSFI